MITVAETVPFQRKIAVLLSDAERTELIAYLSEQPNSGVLIQDTGGRSVSGSSVGDAKGAAKAVVSE